MTPEPRTEDEYGSRPTEAAKRVLVDLGQVLASFRDCVVVVGGWAPDLLLPNAEDPHVGSIDVDLALGAAKLTGGRYAELLQLLLDTGRYRRGARDFQFVAAVDLGDGAAPVQVEVDFLAPSSVPLKRNRPKLLEGFRVLQVETAGEAFRAPVETELEGRNVLGARNSVKLRVVSLGDLLVMKAHAIDGRDKPKDVYDLCYCLEHCPEGFDVLATRWRQHLTEKHTARAVEILRRKVATVDSFGPIQLAEFHGARDRDERARHARRAFELVQALLQRP